MAHRKGVVRYRENPFMSEQSISTRRKRVTVSAKGKAMLDLETGEIENAVEIVMVKEVDSEQFVKLFTQNMRVFFDLSPVTLKLVQVLLSQVQKNPNNDKVMLSIAIAEDYFTETAIDPISKASFHRAIKELLEKQFIAETLLPGLFFINPNLFFNGDRVRFVNEIKRKRGDSEHAGLVEAMRTAKAIAPPSDVTADETSD